MAGEDKVLERARVQLAEGKLEHAMLLVEAALEADADSKAAAEVQLVVLEALLKRAQATYNTFSEVAWLQGQITSAKAKLAN